MKKAITALLIGAGQRGSQSYAPYALEHPGELRFVGVAEPKDFLREGFAAAHDISPAHIYFDYKEAFAAGKIADCVLICTQDNDHVAPALAALDAGYRHILLEKPISKDAKECASLKDKAAKLDAKIMVCHSLRYTNFYRKMREIIARGDIGELCAMTHIEGVGFSHQAHSFVRGDWRNAKESSPMILAKCCHDIDLILYLTGKRCKSVSSFGSLQHFTEKNAPKNTPERCIEGCAIGGECPYNALTIYKNDPHFRQIAIEKEGHLSFTDAMEKGPYGRCVYKCDNDVVDRQVVSLLLEDGVTVTHTMTAFTKRIGRETCIFGTRGELQGNLEEGRITVYDFLQGGVTEYTIPCGSSGHSGADETMIREFVRMVQRDEKSISDISLSVESHQICLAAEDARLKKNVINL